MFFFKASLSLADVSYYLAFKDIKQQHEEHEPQHQAIGHKDGEDSGKADKQLPQTPLASVYICPKNWMVVRL